MTPQQQAQLRELPSVSSLLDAPRVRQWLTEHPRSVVVASLQQALDAARQQVLSGTNGSIDSDTIMTLADEELSRRAAPSLVRVINATGVVLHTGLGRAPLSQAAIDAVVQVARGYCNLEFDLETGHRGRRADHVAGLICELTGAEAAAVVNNNAAATLLILNTVAAGREVIVSRGELVEIGGSYRLPEMMAAGGVRLREVGTTNRTRLADYERAIGDETAALMKVHTSNYRVVGFTQEVSIDELVALGRRVHQPVIHDLGSGLMLGELQEMVAGKDSRVGGCEKGFSHQQPNRAAPVRKRTLGEDRANSATGDAGMDSRLGGCEKGFSHQQGRSHQHEPVVRESISAGVDLVCFSGDKLLGGPQAGIILGRTEWVRAIEANPLMRTYRVDKLTLAALEATLRAYRDEAAAADAVPVLRMLRTDAATLAKRAEQLCSLLQTAAPNEVFEVVAGESVAGGGSMPGMELPSACVAWKPSGESVDSALARLRASRPPVIARAKDDRVVFDVRTMEDEELAAVAEPVGLFGC